MSPSPSSVCVSESVAGSVSRAASANGAMEQWSNGAMEGAALCVAASYRQAAGGAGSERRRFGSMRASLRLSSPRRAPGPQHLALLAGEGAGIVGSGGAGEGAWVPCFASCLLGWQPPLLGAWLPWPGTCTFKVTWRPPSLSLTKLRKALGQAFRSFRNVPSSL